MKALLICPVERSAVRFLAHSHPLAILSAFGKPLVIHWLEHLKTLGAKQVVILAADRPEMVRTVVGDGQRWNLEVLVVSELYELTPETARAEYCDGAAHDWLAAPNDVVVMDYFPGLTEQPLFKSYANWFNSLRALMPRMVAASGNDAKEVKPGVWVSARARISPGVELHAPCWIGAHTVIGTETIIGPMAVLEERVMVESSVEIANSAIAPETFVGELTELRDSIADGSILMNWRTASCTRVPDAFIMCSLGKRRLNFKTGNLPGRCFALLALVLTLPPALLVILWSKIRGTPALRPLVAVRPCPAAELSTAESLTYYELGGGGILRFWPQLWSIVKGDFVWVGNRPLSPGQVAELASDFERLWLATPIGLISPAQAEGALDAIEARAWASLYPLQANWRFDLSIIARALVAATKRSIAALF